MFVNETYGVANVLGSMSDAWEDYWYSETFLVSFTLNSDATCTVQNIKLIETNDEGY